MSLARPAVEMRSVVKRFGNHVTAVDGLDLRIGEGTTYGLLGPNGAGKTTTLRMLLGWPGTADIGVDQRPRVFAW